MDTHIRLPESLVTAAQRRAAALPPDAGVAALTRYALARLAGWPEHASVVAARVPPRIRPADRRGPDQ